MSNQPVTTLSFEADGIAVITFDDPTKRANVLSKPLLDEIEQHLNTLEQTPSLAGVILCSAKPGMFIAGADLREFLSGIDAPKETTVEFCRRGQRLFQRFCSGPFISVAAIDGVSLGGGTELALWCDRRVISGNPKTMIGLPEVKLGLIPGWGGTARLPRIIGLDNAVDLITTGTPVRSEQAMALGLASDIAPSDDLRAAAVRMIREEQTSKAYLADRTRWAGSLPMSQTELDYLSATATEKILSVTRGNYPAPKIALDCMVAAATCDVGEACEIEAGAFAEIFGSPVNRALLNLFFLQDRNKKERGTETKLEPAAIETVSVVGAGIMGCGIAAVNLKRGKQVRLADASEEALQQAMPAVLEEAAFDKKTKQANPDKLAKLSPLLTAATSDDAIAASDIVIEAIVENADTKREVLARLESKLQPETILCTNTSTIPLADLATALKTPDRFCGLHFFNPVRRMPLVEVIRGEGTSDQTIATCVAYAKSLGKSPIVVADGPGFLVNRILFPYLNEALQLVVEGVPLREVDQSAVAFGMPLGPIALLDVVGLDTVVHAGREMYKAFSNRALLSALLAFLYKQGRLGQKNGKGFYTYENDKKHGELDPEVEAIIAERVQTAKKLSQEEQIDRMILPMLLEATRVLEEGIAGDPRDVDLGLILGIGFPDFLGGLLFWADHVGLKTILKKLEAYETLGQRYQPTELLKRLAADDLSFYAPTKD